jgi:TPR repeat protein
MLRSLWVLGLLLALASAVTGPAAGQTLFEGAKAIAEKDYPRALANFKPLADAGDPDALYNLGIMHEFGLGLPENPGEAARLYEQASRGGQTAAAFRAAVMYLTGKGVQQDTGAAVAYFRAAAEGNHTEAQFNLGALYYNGQGVAQDRVEGLKWILLADNAGFPAAVTAREQAFTEMPRDQIDEAQRRANAYLRARQAAEKAAKEARSKQQ